MGVFKDFGDSAQLSKLRQDLSGKQFDTQFMLQLYKNDVLALMERGWDFPDFDKINWKKIEKLINADLNSE